MQAFTKSQAGKKTDDRGAAERAGTESSIQYRRSLTCKELLTLVRCDGWWPKIERICKLMVRACLPAVGRAVAFLRFTAIFHCNRQPAAA